ncbi:ZIP family metal transporter, partial [Halobacteriales archaeon SW_12_69_24]
MGAGSVVALAGLSVLALAQGVEKVLAVSWVAFAAMGT